MFSTEDISLIATVIAACALFATFWQAHLTRRHNRLSVRPLLHWRRSRTLLSEGTEITFILQNFGTGPAVIKERDFYLNGAKFSPQDIKQDLIESLAKTAFAERFKYKIVSHGLPGTDTAIPPGSEFLIAKILFPGYTAEMVEAIFESAGEMKFKVKYESLYEEEFELLAE